ncbi:unnamed protein product [Cochlearia groenlandica]
MIRVKSSSLIVHRNYSDRSSPNEENTVRPHRVIIQEFTPWGKRGFDIYLAPDVVERSLRKHFSSCGEIIRVNVSKYPKDNKHLCDAALINIKGDVGKEKVMALSGKVTEEEGGWTVAVLSVSPPTEDGIINTGATISGYDTSLGEDEIKNQLRQHFSQCGELTRDIRIDQTRGSAEIVISGQDATPEKILQLDGSFMGGFQISVKVYAPIITRPARPFSVMLAEYHAKSKNKTTVICEKRKTTMVKSKKKKKILIKIKKMKKKKKKKTIVKSNKSKPLSE